MPSPNLQRKANLSLVSFTHNDNQLLTEGLLEVQGWSVQPKEIIVVDDASEQFFSAPKLDALPEIKVIRSPGKLGYTKAKALGLNRAASRFILSLDSDIRLIPNWLEICLPQISKPEIGMVSGPIIPKCGDHLFGKYMTLTYNINAGVKGKVKFIPGAAWLMRREVWDEVGGYDGYHETAGEDDYLCKQLMTKGYSLHIEPEAAAFEVRPMSPCQMAARGWKWHGASIYRALAEGRQPLEAVNVFLYSLQPRLNRSKQANVLYLYYDLLYLANALFDLMRNSVPLAALLASFGPWLAPFPKLNQSLTNDLISLGHLGAEHFLLKQNSIPHDTNQNISQILAFAFDQEALNTLNMNLGIILADK